MLSPLRKFDWVLAGAAILLAFFGVVSLIGMAANNPHKELFAHKQLIALAAGIAVMMLVSFFDYRFFRNSPYAVIFIYFFGIALLAVLLAVGEQTRGLTGWFKVGGFAFGPVELVKIIMVLLFAKFFSLRHIEMYRFSHLVVSLAYVGVPCALILLEPDLGSAVIVFALWFAIMIFAGISRKQILFLFFSGAVAAVSGWVWALKAYQKARIISFVNPFHDPQGAGYNAIQSIIAVGDGGIWGRGLGYGSQIQLGFLPEAHTDFMFASIAEEFGLVGAAIIFILLWVIIWRIASIAQNADNNFARLLCVGMIFLIFIQVVINMGMNIGLMPIIGIAFPFLSYGGSNLLAFFLGLGLVQSIKVRSS